MSRYAAYVASIALATMVSNDLVMPVLLRLRGSRAARVAIDQQVLWVRRGTKPVDAPRIR